MKTKLLSLFALSVIIFNFSFAQENNVNSLSLPHYASYFGFIENNGQIIDQNNEPNPACLFLYNGNGLKIQLRKDGFSYEVFKTEIFSIKKNEGESFFDKNLHQNDCTVIHSHRVEIFFENMNNNVLIEKENKSTDYINYYTTGTPEQGISHVYHYGIVRYKNVYPNIDFEFEITKEGKAEYYWIVKPQGNIEDIKLRYEGADETKLQDGEIVMKTSQGNLEERIPASYYLDNKNELVDVSFNQPSNSSIFNYVVSSYNRSRTLVIDPTPSLEWGTYFGGTNGDWANGIITDSKDNVFITGNTMSTSNIATTGAYQTTINSARDAFIAKFSNSGSILWATYYGGKNEDYTRGITKDSNANIYVVGNTVSISSIASIGSHQSIHGGTGALYMGDAFIAKFDSLGLRQWATYFGGNNDDIGNAITTDNQDNIIITGFTYSTNNIATSGSYKPAIDGIYCDVFIAKFNDNGIIQWATYYGGSHYDYGIDIVTDSFDDIIITGFTYSIDSIATIGSYQSSLCNGCSSQWNPDAFIVKFNDKGNLLWGTYYGGDDDDDGNGIDTDNLNSIIITGKTRSSNNIATSGSYQMSIGGAKSVAFIAKFNANGNIEWATYFGGYYTEGFTVETDNQNNIFIGGDTESNSGIATSGSYQSNFGGLWDAFISKFDANGLIKWATYYGGSKDETIQDISFDSNNNIFTTGLTSSSNNIATNSAYQTNLSSVNSSDAFIAKFIDTTYIPPITAINLANSYSANSVFIYPNPAQTTLSIEHSSLEKIEEVIIYNLLGELISSHKTNTTNINLDISHLHESIYLVKTKTVEGEFFQKIIISH